VPDAAIRTQGLGELRRDMRRLAPLAAEELAESIEEAAGKVATTAGALAPRDSGALAHSIRPYVSGARASIGSTLPYAGVVHWGGTIRPRGVPITFPATEFISRAVEDHAGELVEDIADGVDRAARRAGWR
jgi:phage gpG-like protein